MSRNASLVDRIVSEKAKAMEEMNKMHDLMADLERRLKEAAMHDRFDRKMQNGLNRLTRAVEAGRLRSRDVLQQRLGRLKMECSRVARAYRIDVRGDDESLSVSWVREEAQAAYMRHTEGAYLLRTNLTGESEQSLWHMYMQLNDAEAAFRTLKQDPLDTTKRGNFVHIEDLKQNFRRG